MNSLDQEKIVSKLIVVLSFVTILTSCISFFRNIQNPPSSYLEYRNSILTALLIIMNSFFLFYFTFHRKGTSTPKHKIDSTFLWAILGTFIPLFFGFNAFRPLPVIDLLIGTSVIFAITTIINLGKSMDIFVSNRGIQTNGMYRYVRHPLYLSYLMTNFLYLIISEFNVWRVILFCFWVLCIYKRIYYEETFLMKNVQYKEYAQKVKYKLVPRIW